MILGEFEQVVLLAVVQVSADDAGGEAAYGVSIIDEIARRTGRQAADAAVYVTLRRLEQKGLLESWKGQPTAERGGKARRCVKITRLGEASLRESRAMLDKMWRGLNANARRAR